MEVFDNSLLPHELEVRTTCHFALAQRCTPVCVEWRPPCPFVAHAPVPATAALQLVLGQLLSSADALFLPATLPPQPVFSYWSSVDQLVAAAAAAVQQEVDVQRLSAGSAGSTGTRSAGGPDNCVRRASCSRGLCVVGPTWSSPGLMLPSLLHVRVVANRHAARTARRWWDALAAASTASAPASRSSSSSSSSNNNDNALGSSPVGISWGDAKGKRRLLASPAAACDTEQAVRQAAARSLWHGQLQAGVGKVHHATPSEPFATHLLTPHGAQLVPVSLLLRLGLHAADRRRLATAFMQVSHCVALAAAAAVAVIVTRA